MVAAAEKIPGKRSPFSRVITMRNKSASAIIDMGAVMNKPVKDPKATVWDDTKIKYLPWSFWGNDNLLPNQYVFDIETCGVLNGIVDGKATFAICGGPVPVIMKMDPTTGRKVIDKEVDDWDITMFMEMNNLFDNGYAMMMDVVGFNFCAWRFVVDNEGKNITIVKRDDPSELRFEKEDAKGNINHVYYSANWDKVTAPNDNRVIKLPLLSYINPLKHLQELVSEGKREFVYVWRKPGWGKHYYPTPNWMAAYKWVKIAQAVPEMKAALFQNTMRLKWQVIIHEEFWENKYGAEWTDGDEDSQQALVDKFFDEIDTWLVGMENAHKSVFSKGYRDGDGKTWTDIEFKRLEDNTTSGELLPDSAAANTEIAITMVWNLAISGGNQKAGAYGGNEGGSNVRENGLQQTTYHEIHRNVFRKIMFIVKVFNEWHKKHPGIDFIIPATVQTTLDTGAGSKEIVTGNTQTKQKEAA